MPHRRGGHLHKPSENPSGACAMLAYSAIAAGTNYNAEPTQNIPRTIARTKRASKSFPLPLHGFTQPAPDWMTFGVAMRGSDVSSYTHRTGRLLCVRIRSCI